MIVGGLLVAVLVAGITVMSGCGGSQATEAGAVATLPGGTANPLHARVPTSSRDALPLEGGSRAGTHARARHAYYARAAKAGPDNPSATPLSGVAGRPCSLVSQAEARTILGRPVATPHVAPLGPSCIYQTSDGKKMVAITLQRRDFSKLHSQVPALQKFPGLGQQAFCGGSVLYVRVGAVEVLQVTGPCMMVSGFATQALRQLHVSVAATPGHRPAPPRHPPH